MIQWKVSWIPVYAYFVIAIFLVLFQGVSFAIHKFRKHRGNDVAYRGVFTIWVEVLTTYPCLVFFIGVANALLLTAFAAFTPDSALSINLDFGSYLKAELPSQYIIDASNNAVAEQKAKTGNRRRRSDKFQDWNFLDALRSHALETNSAASGGRRLDNTSEKTSGINVVSRALQETQGLNTQSLRYWTIEVFYQAKDPSKGIFTEEALNEIRDFEQRLKAETDYGSFCLKTYSQDACDQPYTVTNLFFSVPDASSIQGDTMEVRYDGSGILASIDSIMDGWLSQDVKWWVDKDFGPANRKSQYTRGTFYGGVPLPGYSNINDRWSEQKKKVEAYLLSIYNSLLMEIDETGLGYNHIIITWYEQKFLQNHVIMLHLYNDCLWSLATATIVLFLVSAQIKNPFIIGVAVVELILAFTATFYFQLVVGGFTTLSCLDFVSGFLIMGIAADDVLLLWNTYDIASAVVGEDATPAEKMSWAYEEAAGAMLVTTVTSCASFYSNYYSIVTIVKQFGFFMGTLTAFNFFHVVVILPAAILINDTYLKPCLRFLCCCRKTVGEDISSKKAADADIVVQVSRAGTDAVQLACEPVSNQSVGHSEEENQPNDEHGMQNLASLSIWQRTRLKAPITTKLAFSKTSLDARKATGTFFKRLPTRLLTERIPSKTSLDAHEPTGTPTSSEARELREESLDCVERTIGHYIAPALRFFRWPLLIVCVISSCVFVYLAAAGFKLSSGELELFDETVNIGRLLTLQKEVFPASSSSDFAAAVSVANPNSAVPYTPPACPRDTASNSSYCFGNGQCDVATGTCTCVDGWMGAACTARKLPGTMVLSFASPLQAPPNIFSYIHVLASPSLTAVPMDTPQGQGIFELKNDGDAPIEWLVTLQQGSVQWLSLQPISGTIPPRSIDRVGSVSSGRSMFRAVFDIGGKSSAWNSSASFELSSPAPGISSRTIGISTAVLPPPALTSLSIVPESVLHAWNGSLALQPEFSLLDGFDKNPTSNLLATPVSNSYYILTPHEVESIKVNALPFTTAGEVYVNGLLAAGLSREIKLSVVPFNTSVKITVTSPFNSQLVTTYELRAQRSHSGFPEFVTGLLFFEVDSSDCPFLTTDTGRSQLAAGIAAVASVSSNWVRAGVNNCSRRLGTDSRRLTANAMIDYTIEIPPGNIITAASVNRSIEDESEASLTQKLQDACTVPIIVVSRTPPDVNPPTTTASSTTTISITASTTETTASTTSILTSTVSSQTSTTTSATVTASTRTTITKTATSITLTQTTETETTSTAITETETTSTATSATESATSSTLTTETVTTSTFTTETSTSATATFSRTSTATSTAESVSQVTGSMPMDVGQDCSTFIANPEATTWVASALADSVGVSVSDVFVTLACNSGDSAQTVDVNYAITATSGGGRLRRLSSSSDILSALQSNSLGSSVAASMQSAAQNDGVALTVAVGTLGVFAVQAAPITSSTTTRTNTRTSATSTSHTITSTTPTLTSSMTRSSTTSLTITSTSITTTTLTIDFPSDIDTLQGVMTIDIGIAASCTSLDTPHGRQALIKCIAEAAQVPTLVISMFLVCNGSRRLTETPAPQHRRTTGAGYQAEAYYGIHIPDNLFLSVSKIWANLMHQTNESMTASLRSNLADVGLSQLSAQVLDLSTPQASKDPGCPGTLACSGPAAGTCSHGTPTMRGASAYSCNCSETYAGADCSMRVCGTCENNGTCAPGSQNLTSVWGCSCPVTAGGRRCENVKCPNQCSGQGTCFNQSGICTCDAGFEGIDCSVIPPKVVPLTNAIELTLVWGLHGYRKDNVSAPDYNSDFDFFAPAVQAWIKETASLVRQEEPLLARQEVPVFIEVFSEATSKIGAPSPLNISSLASTLLQVFMHMSEASVFRTHVVTDGEDFAGKVKYVRLIFKLNMAVNADLSKRVEIRERWDAWVDSRNSGAPPGAGQILVMSGTWASMDLEDNVLSSTIGAFVLSMVSCLIAVVVFTQNAIIATYVTVNILMVVCLIAGTILNVLAFEFGAVEAIGATIFVGLGVDYCLHLAHGYNDAPGSMPQEKLTHTLIVLGPSIVGGAMTTIAGCAFLLPCKMILFRKLGWFLLTNAIYSVLYTFFFLTPLLFICGPVGVAGTIFCFPCLRRFAPDHLVSEEEPSSRIDGNVVLTPVMPVKSHDLSSSDVPPKQVGDKAADAQVKAHVEQELSVPGYID